MTAMEQAPDITDSRPSPGQLLAASRKQSGLSVKAVAEQLYLLPPQVEALEADDYLHFSAEVFCKGHIRAYARLLNLDVDDILSRYEQQASAERTTEQGKPSAKRIHHVQRPARGRSLPYWCLVFVLVLVSVLWLNYRDMEAVAEAADPELTSNVVVDDNDTGLVQELMPEPVAASEPVEGKAIDGGSIDSGLIDEVPIESEAVEAILPQLVASESVTGLSAVPEPAAESAQSAVVESVALSNSLRFKFSADCWVKVVDASDKVLVADLKRAEESLQLNGIAPFKILLGYAPGVSLDYNGEAVVITPDPGKRSARFTLGEPQPDA